jgi:hypothetical protein
MLQREVNPFIDSLRDDTILVTAIHTHWLFDRPRLVYVHFEAVSDPLAFAQAVADAFALLTAAAMTTPTSHSPPAARGKTGKGPAALPGLRAPRYRISKAILPSGPQ